ncbi:hypothetical protein D3C79_582480 [compost metagenome]
MVHRRQATFAIFFEHWEIDHPQRCPAVEFGQAQIAADFQAQRAHGVGNDFKAVGTEEQNVTGLRIGARQDRFQHFSTEEFGNRALHAFHTCSTIVNLQPCQTFGTVDINESAVFIDLFTGQLCTTRNTNRGHAAFGIVRRAREHFKLNVFNQVGNVHQFQRVTQVWLIGTVTAHRFGKGHDREFTQIDALHVQPQFMHQLLHHFTHLLGAHERGFHVYLGEFRLTIRAQVFVTEALDDLVVTVEARHHQQLFEQLWGLRQCVELTFMYAAWYQIVTGTFRRSFGQHWGFDIQETVAVHKAAHKAGDLGTGFQAVGHFRATQIQIAIFQTRFFAIGLVRVQRQRFGAVDDLKLMSKHLNFASRHILVGLAFRARTHGTDDLDAELVTQFEGFVEGRFLIRIEEHLDDAFAVTHINKDQATQIAAAVDPTTQSDFLADVGQIQLPAIFSTHTLSF